MSAASIRITFGLAPARNPAISAAWLHMYVPSHLYLKFSDVVTEGSTAVFSLLFVHHGRGVGGLNPSGAGAGVRTGGITPSPWDGDDAPYTTAVGRNRRKARISSS